MGLLKRIPQNYEFKICDFLQGSLDPAMRRRLIKGTLGGVELDFGEGDDRELFDKTNWTDAVIKPAISGAARNTYRITPDNCFNHEKTFHKLITEECMLFQEFLNNIILNGEISLIMIARKYTHAVKKIAKKGDFRVQDDHGGIVEKYEATSKEIKFAEKCIEKCPFSPIYARVDIVYDNNNQPSLSELELIEPELWFRNNPNSVEMLSNEIKKSFF